MKQVIKVKDKPKVIKEYDAVQYDGNNGDDLIAFLVDKGIEAYKAKQEPFLEDAGVLTIETKEAQYLMNITDYMLVAKDETIDLVGKEVLSENFDILEVIDDEVETDEADDKEPEVLDEQHEVAIVDSDE